MRLHKRNGAFRFSRLSSAACLRENRLGGLVVAPGIAGDYPAEALPPAVVAGASLMR